MVAVYGERDTPLTLTAVRPLRRGVLPARLCHRLQVKSADDDEEAIAWLRRNT